MRAEKRSSRVARVAGLVAVASCGPVAPPPPSLVPVNSCATQSDCAPYVQPDGLAPPICGGSSPECVSDTAIDFTLVVSLPDTSSQSDPGTTIAIPNFYSSYIQQIPNQCGQGPGSLDCAILPGAVQSQGELVANQQTQDCALSSRGESASLPAVLPASVQFWPLWSGSSTWVPAPAAGIPVAPVAAQLSVEASLGSGPSGAPATQWTSYVPPGTYEEDIVPVDPAYPPQRVAQAPSSDFSGFAQLSVTADADECPPPPGSGTTPENTTFSVVRGNGSLGGFSVYFRDATTLRRASSQTTLPDLGSAPVTLLTQGRWVTTANGTVPPPAGTLDIVVTPPAGAPIPTYVTSLLTVTGQVSQVEFPPLPAPVTVGGTVVDSGGHPIEAGLLIQSTSPTAPPPSGLWICTTDDCAQTTNSSSVPRPLTFETTAQSSAVDGTFSVVLPPGYYTAFITPAFGVAAGSTSTSIGVQPGLPVAEGLRLSAAAQATIFGTATIADGRPLVGAEVEAHAAVWLASQPTPWTADPRLWPRTVTTTTDAAGVFSMAADPGVYDVVVRPQDGTGFPWVTTRKVTVPSQALQVTIPAPVVLTLSLEDQLHSAVAGAVVRAYATPSGAPAVTLGGPAAQIELGTWLTDSQGNFSMAVVPP